MVSVERKKKKLFRQKENHMYQDLHKERKYIREEINESNIKSIFFLFLIDLKISLFKAILVIVSWVIIDYNISEMNDSNMPQETEEIENTCIWSVIVLFKYGLRLV